MVRNLYRVYLYSVYIALLIFVTFVVGFLLDTVLELTPLSGQSGSVLDVGSVIQAFVLVAVACAIAGGFAGLHYWLIRRDMRNDVAAGASAIRSFFLNVTEASGIALAVPVAGFFVLNALADSSGPNVAVPTAVTLATFMLVGLLALEKRRTQAGAGAALAFQRLHFYGIQILLLIFMTISWFIVLRPLLYTLIFANGGILPPCVGITCSAYNPFFLVSSVLWFIGFWIGYGWLVRNDNSSPLRLILHCLGLAYGVGFVLDGLYQVFQILFLFLFHMALVPGDVVGLNAGHDFFSSLTLGILVVGAYYGWLRMAARQGLIERRVLDLVGWAIAAILAAGAFWWGSSSIIYNALQVWMPIPAGPEVNDWVVALALMASGVGYLPISFYLQRRNTLDPMIGAGPRRGFVLALCGGGILALAIGSVIAFYAWLTRLLGLPIIYWQQVVHRGLATAIIGAILVAVYLPFALRERLFSAPLKRPDPIVAEPMVPSVIEPMGVLATSIQSPTLEKILDEMLGGKIARDEAVSRIRALEHLK